MPMYTAENTAGRNPEVYVDGVKADMVIFADTDEGKVCRFRRDESGDFVISGDEFETETIRGNVDVVFRVDT